MGMRNKALQIWPGINKDKIIVQPQGVVTCQSDSSLQNILQVYPAMQEFGDVLSKFQTSLKLFLFVGGIRPVKDPMYLIETFSKWHMSDSSIHFVIIGPELHKEYSNDCRKLVDRSPGVWWFPVMTLEHVHCLMKHSFALVNSSINEGMAGAILEAMDIGVPVIARCNYSNQSIITDMVNGLLYSNQQEFLEKAKTLIDESTLRANIAINAKAYIQSHNDWRKENNTYVNLIENAFSS